MAIKGYLGEVTFVELLKVVSKYNGLLRLWDFTGNKQYECFFYRQSVIYLKLCGTPVTEKELVKDVFFELLTECKCYYSFEKAPVVPEHDSPIVSVSELLDFSVFEMDEPIDEFLPHINTRFESADKVDFDLQGDLGDFWRDSLKFLHKGCSGYDLCVELGLEERSVRQNLYRLRTTGLIKPVRKFKPAHSLKKPRRLKQNSGDFVNDASDAQNKQVLIEKEVSENSFLANVRVPVEDFPVAAGAVNEAPPSENKTLAPAKRSSLLRRMLNSLFRG